jgi:hypothetical protein
MNAPSPRTRRYIVLLGFFSLAFLLYPAAESGSATIEVILLALIFVLMVLAIWTG